MAESITLARPYAKAAFEVAVADKTLASWSEMLGTLAAITADEKVGALLSSPSLIAEEQVKILIDICGDQANEAYEKVQNMLRLLAENKRLTLLPDIAQIYETFRANYEKTVDVELSTAFELNESVVNQLTLALQKRLDRQINLHTRVDKRLIGGAVIRAGDTVIDNSVRGKLNKLAESMNS